ncbi:hypothetical protein [Streptomyces anandii]
MRRLLVHPRHVIRVRLCPHGVEQALGLRQLRRLKPTDLVSVQHA